MIALCGGVFPASSRAADSQSDEAWPRQKVPAALVETDLASLHFAPGGNARLCPEHMLVESLAGLAAQAVNDGRGDELVWISGESPPDYQTWHDDLVRRLHLQERGSFDPWQLLDRCRSRGLVKGYILYQFDSSPGEVPALRQGSDLSANVATSLAGLLGGVLISPELEPRAKAMHLPLLMDVRGKSPAWCFAQFGSQFNRHFALAQDPKMPQNRDIAIAHRMFVLWGRDEPTPSVYRRLLPGSTILGWNAGDEGKMVSQLSAFGHVLAPSNWAIDLCACSAGSDIALPGPRFAGFDPRRINWADHAAGAAFVLSDGDNIQWMMGNFCHHADYWASPDAGKFRFGFGVAASPLEQAAPQVLDYLTGTRPLQSSIVQASAGYFYPDLLGQNLPPAERDALLAARGRQINDAMERAGVHVLMLYCMDPASPAAQHAYDVMASRLKNVVGLLAIKYSPYAGGAGRVFWANDSTGTALPIVTARYALWADVHQPNTGTPQQVATMINAAAHAAPADQPLLCWIIQHAWSNFATDPQTAERGVAPSLDCVRHLDPAVRAMSVEEMLWRTRMQREPRQTRAAIAGWQP